MQSQFTKKQIIFLAVAGVFALIVVLLLVGVVPGRRGTGGKAVDLTVWGVDPPDVWANTINRFRVEFPNVRAAYQQLGEGSYEETLLNALAEGNGPDVFMFDNNWLVKHKNKIISIPREKISSQTLAVFPGKEVSSRSIATLFPRAVEQDFILGGEIYALPLYIDTLALIYNRDHFDQAGIAVLPRTWAEFNEHIPALRHAGEDGELTRMPVALGGPSRDIENAVQLINLFFLQASPATLNEDSEAIVAYGGIQRDAFLKYLSYANPKSGLYSWTNGSRNDFDSFARGDVSAVFAYQKQLEAIRTKNSLLNWAAGDMLQVSDLTAVNYPDYYGLAVSNRTKNRGVAWDFVVFATTSEDSAEYYATTLDLTPALRSLIKTWKELPGTGGVYARQALTARSWLVADPDQASAYLDEAIADVASGFLNPEEVLRRLNEEMENVSEYDVEYSE
jgi:ABC-type glycerol-3-phosphate transport system substrate-binding protein